MVERMAHKKVRLMAETKALRSG
jgi:hypothetical protein